MNGMIIILSGPSGAGKGRVGEELLKRHKNMRKVLSVTSRQRREDDVGKTNYNFVTEQEFLDMKQKGIFFETNYYDGNWYGTLKVPTEELIVRDIIFDKDVNGALAIKKKYPEAISIYILPKDKETLLERRGNRGAGRTQIAIEEIPKAKSLDFLVVNDNIEDAVNQVDRIIECMRMCSMKNPNNIEFMDKFYD